MSEMAIKKRKCCMRCKHRGTPEVLYSIIWVATLRETRETLKQRLRGSYKLKTIVPQSLNLKIS